MAFTVRTKARPTIHEFDLIRALHRRHGHRTVSVIQGIGDDAAIITSRAGQWTVLTTDLFTEGVHFDLRTATMDDIGFRAAAANLSDIAAMGGTPQHLLVALAIPRTGTSRHHRCTATARGTTHNCPSPGCRGHRRRETSPNACGGRVWRRDQARRDPDSLDVHDLHHHGPAPERELSESGL